MTEIPYVDESELGSQTAQEEIALLSTLADEGKPVPRTWLLAQLGNIKAESLPSKLARRGFKSSTRSMVNGDKAVTIERA